MSKVDRIMLRFRPIVPKPATATSGSSVLGGRSSPKMSDVSPRSGRGKRKCNNTSNSTNSKKYNSGGKRKRKVLGEENKAVVDFVVTLPLLPETPDQKNFGTKELKTEVCPGSVSPKPVKSKWLSFDGKVKDQAGHQNQTVGFGVSVDQTLVMPRVVNIVESCVTVECVTDTWVDVDGLGCTDDEKKINMEKDMCPGFISDGYGRVTWKNEAYRKMVGQGEGGDHQVFVWLAMKEKVPMKVTIAGHKAFTSRVRV